MIKIHDQPAKNNIGPGKSFTGEIFGIILMKRFMHKSRSCMNAIINKLMVIQAFSAVTLTQIKQHPYSNNQLTRIRVSYFADGKI